MFIHNKGFIKGGVNMTNFNKTLWVVYTSLLYTQFAGATHDINVYINNHTHLKFNLSVKHQGTPLADANNWKTKSQVLEPYQENTDANMIFAINSYLPQGVHFFTVTLDNGVQKIRLTQKFTSKSLNIPCYIEIQPTDCFIKLITHKDQPIYIFCTTQGLDIIYWIIEKQAHEIEQTTSLINSWPQCSEKHNLGMNRNNNHSLSNDNDKDLDCVRQRYIPSSTLDILTTIITTLSDKPLTLRNRQDSPQKLYQKECTHCSSKMNSMLGEYIIKTNPEILSVINRMHHSSHTSNMLRLHTIKAQL